MADTKEGQKAQGVQAGGAFKGKNQTLTLIGVVTGHVPVHLYGQGFLLILPYLSSTLGLATIQAGLIETIRRAGGGVASIGGGVVTDRYQHLRGHFLGASLVLMALGYLVAGVVPTGSPAAYVFLLLALGFASAMGVLLAPAGGQRPVPAFPGAARHGHLAPPLQRHCGRYHRPAHRRRAAAHHFVADGASGGRRSSRWPSRCRCGPTSGTWAVRRCRRRRGRSAGSAPRSATSASCSGSAGWYRC